LGLLELFDGSCFGHALSKVCISLSYASIKVAQGAIQKCVTWPKKLGNDMQAWIRLALILD
jgi:hypothetical protein